MPTTDRKAAAGTIFLAFALIAAALLPAVQFVGISYADDDRGKDRKDKDRDRDRKDKDRDDDDRDRDRDDDNNDNDNSDGLIIELLKDTYLRKDASNTNYGNNDALKLTHVGSNRVLIAFDLSDIEGPVESVKLQLYIAKNGNDWKGSSQTISIHALTQYWEEGNGARGPGATWQCAVDTQIGNSKPDCEDKWKGGDFVDSPSDEISMQNGIEGWIEFDVTEDVNRFLSGEAENYGWLIKKDQENRHGSISFASSETDKKPVIVIEGGTGGSENSPPNAVDDFAATNEDTPVTFNVLANDSDPDGDALTAALAASPSHGSVVIQTSGSATYTPAANHHGSDSFTYTVSDGSATAMATVTITVNPVNDAPVASSPTVSAEQDGTATITLPATDIDGDSLTYVIVSSPQHGTLEDDEDGDDTVTYTPTPGFTGEDSFTFKANDGSADSNVATVSITVTELPNRNPVAADDLASTDEGDSVTIDVLENDSDADGDTLYVVLVSDPPHGTAVINEDNTITYTPDETYSGSDSFTYDIEDGQGGSDSATVNVTINIINGQPVANGDSATTNEGSPVTINVVSNDSDPDGDPISISSLSTPTFGTAAVAPGGILYTPTIQSLRPGQHQMDSFTYTITDGIEDDTATVTVKINGINNAPMAADGTLITDEDDPVSYILPATDPDTGDTLTLAITVQPASGGIVLNLGSIIYTPDLNFVGTDSFTYSATDGSGASDAGVITVTVNPVNDPPVAVDDAAPTTPPGISVIISVLPNDFDVEGDELDIISVSTPSHGLAILNPDNTVTFIPDLDLLGQDSFDYVLSDGEGGLDTGTVLVTVAGGSLIAIDDVSTTEANKKVKIRVLDNDIGVNMDTEMAIAEDPLNGVVSISPDGSIEYEPDEDFVGTDVFVYTIYDDINFDTATVIVTVLPDLL